MCSSDLQPFPTPPIPQSPPSPNPQSTGRLVPGAPYDDAPVPAARVATSALAFALSGALLVRLALTSPPFRAYLLLSSAAAAAVARADPLWW